MFAVQADCIVTALIEIIVAVILEYTSYLQTEALVGYVRSIHYDGQLLFFEPARRQHQHSGSLKGYSGKGW